MAELSYGTVKGLFADTIPTEDVPITGTITFTPEAEWLLSPETDPKQVILPTPKKITINSSAFSVEILSTDNEALNPTDWTYRVDFDISMAGTKWTKAPISIKVPANTITDLSLIMPVGSSEGVLITQGPKGDKGDKGDPGVGVQDTGLRKLRQGVYIRRVASVVMLTLNAYEVAEDNILEELYDLQDDGFFPDKPYSIFQYLPPYQGAESNGTPINFQDGATVLEQDNEDFLNRLYIKMGNTNFLANGRIAWMTSDPWPAVFPGTAA